MTAFEPEDFNYDFWKDADKRAGWDDLEPGETVESKPVTITKEIIQRYARSIGDHRRMETRFRRPIYPGDTVQVHVEVRDKRETRKGKWLDCAVTVTNQNGDVVATGDALAEMAA